MKNINVKKIVAGAAALGVGALMISGAMAANVTPTDWTNVTKEDLFNNGVPAVNVVVGSLAQPIDVVWAGNIAAAIGKNANTVVEGSEGGFTFNNVVVEVGSEGTSTVSGDGLLVDTYTINANAVDKTLDDQDYTVLSEEDISIDSTYAGASTLTVYDELTVGANIWFNDDKDVKDLVASVNNGAITYTVDFDEGIQNDYTNSVASGTFKFNLMGTKYTLDSYDGTTLKLIKAIGTDTYAIGETFEVEDYTIEVSAILDTGSSTTPYEVELLLKDSDGTVVSTDTFASGDTSVFSSYIDSTVDVSTVYASVVKIVTGEGATLELKNGSKIDNFPENGDKIWQSSFTTSGNYLTALTLTTNDTDMQFTNDDSLLVGDSIDLPLGLGSIDFLGLTEEDSSLFVVKDNYIEFTDLDRKDHTIFLYDYDEASTARTTYYSPLLDDKELYFKFYDSTSTADANFTVQLNDSDGKYLAGAQGEDPTWVSATPTYYTTADRDLGAASNDANVGILYDLEIPLYNNETKDVGYTILIQPAAAGDFDSVKDVAIGLTLDQTTELDVGDTTYTWDVTNIDGDGADASGISNEGQFIGDRVDTNTTNTNYARDEFESIAEIKLSNDTDTALTVYMDAYTGDLVDLSDNLFIDTYKQVEYTDATPNTFSLSDEGNDADLEFGYTTYGAYVSIEDGYFEATLPEKQLKGQIFIGGGASTETTLVGDTLTLTTEGEVVEGDGVSAKLVSKNIEGTGAEAAIIPAVWNPANLVILDSQSTANPKVIVGGYLVNTLAQGIGLEDVVTTSGNYVVGKNIAGNIIVAGMDATDTASAARELIAAIEAM
jgi:hypothetical protein